MADSHPQQRALSVVSTRTLAEPVVFLSYSHAEAPIALEFAQALASRGLRLLVDTTQLKPGEDIYEFARRSVREADATVCIVSRTSLSSSWVVLEALTAIQKELSTPQSRLIACATDQTFFNLDLRLELTKSIDERLLEIKKLLAQYLDDDLDMTDLSAERSRLIKMRASLGDILARLRDSLTLLVTEANLLESATRVADHIRELRGQPPSRNDPRDIRARAEELRDLVSNAQTDEALDRLLDFIREFSDLPKTLREATLVANTLRRVEKAVRDTGLSYAQAEMQRQPMILKMLELIDEVEINPQLPLAS